MDKPTASARLRDVIPRWFVVLAVVSMALGAGAALAMDFM